MLKTFDQKIKELTQKETELRTELNQKLRVIEGVARVLLEKIFEVCGDRQVSKISVDLSDGTLLSVSRINQEFSLKIEESDGSVSVDIDLSLHFDGGCIDSVTVKEVRVCFIKKARFEEIVEELETLKKSQTIDKIESSIDSLTESLSRINID